MEIKGEKLFFFTGKEEVERGFGRKSVAGKQEFGVVATSHWLGCCWVRRKSSLLLLGWKSKLDEWYMCDSSPLGLPHPILNEVFSLPFSQIMVIVKNKAGRG